MKLNAAFSKAIKELRAKEGLTQDELAEMLDISRKQMQNIEQRRSLPSMPILCKLREKFAFSIDAVFDMEKQPKSAAIERLARELENCNPEQLEEITEIIHKILRLSK